MSSTETELTGWSQPCMVRVSGPDPRGLKLLRHPFYLSRDGTTTLSCSGTLLPLDSPYLPQHFRRSVEEAAKCTNDGNRISVVFTSAAPIQSFSKAAPAGESAGARFQLVPGACVDVLTQGCKESGPYALGRSTGGNTHADQLQQLAQEQSAEELQWVKATPLLLLDQIDHLCGFWDMWKKSSGSLPWTYGWPPSSSSSSQPHAKPRASLPDNLNGPTDRQGPQCQIAILFVRLPHPTACHPPPLHGHVQFSPVRSYLSLGAPVRVVSSPFGILSPPHFYNCVSSGIVSNLWPAVHAHGSQALDDSPPTPHTMLLDIKGLPGMEGAPVFHGSSARLLGILMGPLHIPQLGATMQIAITMDAVLDAWMRQAKAKMHTVHPPPQLPSFLVASGAGDSRPAIVTYGGCSRCGVNPQDDERATGDIRRGIVPPDLRSRLSPSPAAAPAPAPAPAAAPAPAPASLPPTVAHGQSALPQSPRVCQPCSLLQSFASACLPPSPKQGTAVILGAAARTVPPLPTLTSPSSPFPRSAVVLVCVGASVWASGIILRPPSSGNHSPPASSPPSKLFVLTNAHLFRPWMPPPATQKQDSFPFQGPGLPLQLPAISVRIDCDCGASSSLLPSIPLCISTGSLDVALLEVNKSGSRIDSGIFCAQCCPKSGEERRHGPQPGCRACQDTGRVAAGGGGGWRIGTGVVGGGGGGGGGEGVSNLPEDTGALDNSVKVLRNGGSDVTEPEPAMITVAEDRHPQAGDKVLVIGHAIFPPAMAMLPSVSAGEILKVVYSVSESAKGQGGPKRRVPAMIVSNAAVFSGNSGGALVDASSGRLLGLVTSNTKINKSTVLPHLNFSIPITTLGPILEMAGREHVGPLPFNVLSATNPSFESVWSMSLAQQRPSERPPHLVGDLEGKGKGRMLLHYMQKFGGAKEKQGRAEASTVGLKKLVLLSHL